MRNNKCETFEFRVRVTTSFNLAYCAGIKVNIIEHVPESLLCSYGKRGYVIGVHAMRELAVQAKRDGWVIMLLHFSNAFNTVERNLMLRLVTAHCPKMTKLTYRLYEQEPHLITSTGDTVNSSTGTQQGCSLSSPLLTLTMQYLSQSIHDIHGLHAKQFFWDDTALVGTPEAVARLLSR